MPKSWANYGGDLHLELGGSRVRVGLEAALRAAVRSGRLPPGIRLPSSRDLAADLGVARNTVADAYGQLVAEGWLAARTGSGTWVSERPIAPASPPVTAVRELSEPRYDLRPGMPNVAAFPRSQWLATARAALSACADNVLGYPDPRGLPELRTALAEYLARARGVSACPERIVICSGFTHGLALICRVLSGRGARVVATEACGLREHQRVAKDQGLRIRSLALDAQGAVADLSDSAAALLTPAHQFPLGMTLAASRRADFIAWAAGNKGLLIEDDYDGEFRYDRQPVGAMQALAPEHVVYGGTASKSLAPGLRLGWLVVPSTILDEVIAVKEASGCNNGILDQIALARFIQSGGYDRQIRQARLAYRRRRDQLVNALRGSAPRVHVTGIAAGQHAVVELPADVSENAVVASAARHAVAVEGLASYAAAGLDLPPALVVGYGRPADHAFSTALGRLCAALAEVTAGPVWQSASMPPT